MADWSFPILTSLYADLITLFKSRDDDCAKMFDGVTASNLPLSTIKWSSANKRFEKWNGTVFNALESSYNINVTMFNGQLASYYTNISNMNTGSLPAARFSDTSHGARAGGTLHSVASTTVHGFMSSTDKSKLNGIENNATADQTKADIDSLGIAAATALKTIYRGVLAYGSLQAVPNGFVNVTISFPNKVYDTDSIHLNTRFTVPAGVSKIRMKASIRLTIGGKQIIVRFDKNGIASGYPGEVNADQNQQSQVSTAVLSVIAGDYFECIVRQNSISASENIDYNSWAAMEIVE